MSIYKRLSRAIRANINAVNPEPSLTNQIRQMEAAIVQFRKSIAMASVATKRMEEKYRSNLLEIERWKNKAKLALSQGDESLAKEALCRQQYLTENVTKLKNQIEFDNNQTINSFKQKIVALEAKINDYKLLQAKYIANKAQRQLQETIGGIDTSSAMGAFERMEDQNKIMQLEAESTAAHELVGIGLEPQFVQLEASSGVDDELAAMKAQLSGGYYAQAAFPATESTDSAIDAELDELRSQLDK